jgi:hypothetical protein
MQKAKKKSGKIENIQIPRRWYEHQLFKCEIRRTRHIEKNHKQKVKHRKVLTN